VSKNLMLTYCDKNLHHIFVDEFIDVLINGKVERCRACYDYAEWREYLTYNDGLCEADIKLVGDGVVIRKVENMTPEELEKHILTKLKQKELK